MAPREHELILEATYPEPQARIVEESLAQEAADLVDERCRTRIDREGGRVTVAVEAADLVALRAATNTWLGLLAVAEETAELADRGF